jgi:hypothetical protein
MAFFICVVLIFLFSFNSCSRNSHADANHDPSVDDVVMIIERKLGWNHQFGIEYKIGKVIGYVTMQISELLVCKKWDKEREIECERAAILFDFYLIEETSVIRNILTLLSDENKYEELYSEGIISGIDIADYMNLATESKNPGSAKKKCRMMLRDINGSGFSTNGKLLQPIKKALPGTWNEIVSFYLIFDSKIGHD